MKQERTTKKKKTSFALFLAVVAGWFGIDRAVKATFNASYDAGDVIVPSIAGLFRFDVVHNSGAAWGVFTGAAAALVVVAVIACLIISVVAWRLAGKATWAEMLGMALVVAGGMGNCVDRLIYGYVFDFITPLFISFPTFNIADIGITVGVLCVLIGYVYRTMPRTDTQR